MASRVPPRLLEQQVVVAALPNSSGLAAMDPEVHLAWLDQERRALCLKEATISDGGNVRTGPEHVVSLAGGAEVATPESGVIQLFGPDGRLLAQMHAESEDDARTWAGGLRALAGTRAAPAPPPGARATAQELHERSNALQSKISGLEHITRRRDQQLKKMHGRLQGAMEMLSAVQEMCNQQRTVIQAQQEAIEILERERASAPDAADGRSRLSRKEDHDASHAAAGAVGAAVVGGPQSDLDAEDAEDVEKKAEKMLALLRQADQMQQLLQTLTGGEGQAEPEPAPTPPPSGLNHQGGSRLAPPGPTPAPAPSPAEAASDGEEDDDFEDDGEEATAAELLDRLQKLEAEKRRFEGMLQNSMQEQQDMVQRLTDMRSLMSSLQGAAKAAGQDDQDG